MYPQARTSAIAAAPQLFPQLLAHHGGGRLLDHLLVAPLKAALPLAEVQDAAVRVGDHLDLDVPCALDVALHDQPVVAKCRARLPAGGGDRLRQLLEAPHDAHPLASASTRRLQQHRQGLTRDPLRDLLVAEALCAKARHDRDPGVLRGPLGGGLVAEQRDRLGARPDEYEARLAAGAGEVGAL